MDIEKKLEELLDEANEERNKIGINEMAGFYFDEFPELTDFILNILDSENKENIKIIADNMDRILPFIVDSNCYEILGNTLLVNQSSFKDKFRKGLYNYPYKGYLNELLSQLDYSLADEVDDFFDKDMLLVLSNIYLDSDNNWFILNHTNEENQEFYLKKLIQLGRDFPFDDIEYLGDNKKIIYEDSFIKNCKYIYSLRNFAKDDENNYSKVKDYIDTHKEDAIESIFNEIKDLIDITEPAMKDFLKLLIFEVCDEEKVKLSDIEFRSGAYSSVLVIGDKVLKLGSRETKKFPNNPYIVSPLLRREININNDSCFVEVTERVDTSKEIGEEELYELYRNIRDLGLVWTDVHQRNVGVLLRDNIRYFSEDIDPSDEVLGFEGKRGKVVLKKGSLVVLDSDFIFAEEELGDTIIVPEDSLYSKFEDRYQSEYNKNNNDKKKI